jgi:dTDP-4-amino-4,6-dideoxygalactose transaminase
VYRFFIHQAGNFPVSEQVAVQLLSPPIYPALTVEQIEYVASQEKGCRTEEKIRPDALPYFSGAG